MINIIKEEIKIEETLKQRIEFICEFLHTIPTFINGFIHKVDKTNLSYVEPHKIIIKGITFLAWARLIKYLFKSSSNLSLLPISSETVLPALA